MAKFEEVCKREIKWRSEEIALLKKAVINLNATPQMQAVLRRYVVPALYALWEGFVTFIFGEYVAMINASKKKVRQVNVNIVRHDIINRFNLLQIPRDAERQKQLLKDLKSYFDNRIDLSPVVPTSSNVDFAQLKKILGAFGVEWPEVKKYESDMQEFLQFRHGIAHGNMEFKDVGQDRIDKFSSLVNDLMYALMGKLGEHVHGRMYLTNPLG